MVELPLLRAIPSLAEVHPRLPLAELPTPVRRLSRLAPSRGLYLKDDAYAGDLFGGNKVRKLEFLLGEARAQGKRRLFTIGFAGSNHAVSTAVYGQAFGFEVTCALLPQPHTNIAESNLKRLIHSGAHLTPTRAELAATCFQDWYDEDPDTSYRIPAGGTSAVGSLGIVNAAFELACQIKAGELPQPKAIYVPIGTVGTAVGLAVGLYLAQLPLRVVAVRVVDSTYTNEARVGRHWSELAELLRGHTPELPTHPQNIEWDHDCYEPGYGRTTQAVLETQHRAQSLECLRLDPSYTAKSLYAAVASQQDPVIFWNTGHGRDDGPHAHLEIPAALARLIKS